MEFSKDAMTWEEYSRAGLHIGAFTVSHTTIGAMIGLGLANAAGLAFPKYRMLLLGTCATLGAGLGLMSGIMNDQAKAHSDYLATVEQLHKKLCCRQSSLSR